MFNFGIVIKDGVPTHHRSVFKIILNPFLRIFGWEIVSLTDSRKNFLRNPSIEYQLRRSTGWSASIFFKLQPDEYVLKHRVWY